MSKVSLYEPAMCCDTGVCGPGVDTELLRVSSIIQTLEKADGVEVVSILVLISQRIRKKNNQIVAALHHLDVAKTKKLKLMRRDSHRLFY